MKLVIEISKKDFCLVNGGSSCYGLWIGTTDGKYGACIGVSVE
jgi:hypothetical protein